MLVIFSSSSVITAVIYHYAIKKNILDIPNIRSSHYRPTPRGGGLSIVITFSLSLIVLLLIDKIDSNIFWALFVGGILIAIIGFWDDQKHIPAGKRVIVHMIAAMWAIFWLGGGQLDIHQNGLLNQGWLSDIVVLISIVWLLNLYNFMDGIDGIAGSEAIFVTLAAILIILLGNLKSNELNYIVNYEKRMIEYLLLTLFMAVSGFLAWNWPPAKIFMGDVGSSYLGYILAIFAISTAIHNILSVWVWLILLGIFIVDATITLCRRFVTGQRWYEAHRSHAYQHAALKVSSHKKVTLSVLAIDILWLLPLGWLAANRQEWGIVLTVIAYIPLIFIALYLKAGKAKY